MKFSKLKKIIIFCTSLLLFIVSFSFCFDVQGSTCSNEHPNYFCTECGSNCEAWDCFPNLCSGGATKQCCPPNAKCQHSYPTYSCKECGSNCAKWGCVSGLCGSGTTNKCCPTTTNAEDEDDSTGTSAGTLFNQPVSCIKDGNCSVTDIVNVAIIIAKYLMGLIGSIALLFFIIAGIKMLTSHGNSSQISSAKTMMVQTIIGIIICLCAFLIVDFVRKTLLKGTVYNETLLNDSYKL